MRAQSRTLIIWAVLLIPIFVVDTPVTAAKAPRRFIVHTNQEGTLTNLVRHSNQEGQIEASTTPGSMRAYAPPHIDVFVVVLASSPQDSPNGPGGWVSPAHGLVFSERPVPATDLQTAMGVGAFGVGGASGLAPRAAVDGRATSGAVPGPGALPVLGLVAVVGRRRRRARI